jgi:predicted DNA-binding transcriptional regulator AlpA
VNTGHAGGATRTTILKKLISTKQAAEMLGTTVGTLKSWRSRGIGPNWVKLGAAVRYDVEELLDFIKRNTRVPSVRALVEDRRGAL